MAENLSERSHLFQSEQTDLQDTHGNNYHDEDIRNKTKGSTSGEDKKIENGDHIISAKYESLDYDTIENELYQQEGRIKTKSAVWKEFNRWLVMGLVGVITGLIASFIDYMVVQATQLKFGYVHQYIEFCVKNLCLEEPFLIWIAFNAVLVFIGSFLTSFIEPVAAGSGIPQIKCFLNGVKIPHVVRLKTIVCKVLGVICAVAGGLVVGKEGPMIHSGAVVAAGISQGKIDALHLDLKIFEYFRSDTEKRDFVSGGAAAGVSAAFGAPVGGVLFSLEEGASFWNQALTWRIFFASMISTFTLNIVQSYIKDKPWNLSYPGLFNFGSFDKTDYSGFEIPLFVIMGVVGGLIGALFNHINYKLSVFRIRFVKKKWMHVVEAIIVAVLTGTVGYITLYFLNDCQPPKTDEQYDSAQIFCDDGQYSTTSSVLFQTPEESVKKMFHEPPGTYGAETLVVYGICCFLLACWTYGLYVPSGLFIPSLLIGAIWGRLFGMLLNVIFPDMNWVNLEKYSLIGAAAQLGGIVRMTISLTVIIVEASGNITFGLPVMIVLMVAKWIGDLFNEGIYDMHIHLQGVPLLGWEPSSMLSNINAM
ncbi:hypothetical protein KUTeg_004056 [Tegillarca granosa]|uniref:H(+)/Cl(-) exchange transporter 7 n=1 Tax=Tegillarca granosa TaxID=220873 RepID=A0ABQ9FNY7_TEGGR|nr:hypothetical protein KUTeg_004056 [Tegillarca granosa]